MIPVKRNVFPLPGSTPRHHEDDQKKKDFTAVFHDFSGTIHFLYPARTLFSYRHLFSFPFS
jgi:hypothetical protein